MKVKAKAVHGNKRNKKILLPIRRVWSLCGKPGFDMHSACSGE